MLENNNSEDTMKYIWCAINTCLIFLLFMYCYLGKSINTEAMDKVKELELKLEVYENMQPDTVIINVNNYINTK